MKHREYPKAIARICGGTEYPTIRGMVQFFQHGDGVLMEAEVWGLPRTKNGFFAFHIHEGGSCCGAGRIEEALSTGERLMISRHYAPALRERLGM